MKNEVINMNWREDESLMGFRKRIADRLYKYIGTDYECRMVEVTGCSSISIYYRMGEAIPSRSYYVYEIGKEGDAKEIEWP